MRIFRVDPAAAAAAAAAGVPDRPVSYFLLAAHFADWINKGSEEEEEEEEEAHPDETDGTTT